MGVLAGVPHFGTSAGAEKKGKNQAEMKFFESTCERENALQCVIKCPDEPFFSGFFLEIRKTEFHEANLISSRYEPILSHFFLDIRKITLQRTHFFPKFFWKSAKTRFDKAYFFPNSWTNVDFRPISLICNEFASKIEKLMEKQ